MAKNLDRMPAQQLAEMLLDMPQPDNKWARKANCAETAISKNGPRFFADKGNQRKEVEAARDEYCRSCPVRVECLWNGTVPRRDTKAFNGVWGGQLPDRVASIGKAVTHLRTVRERTAAREAKEREKAQKAAERADNARRKLEQKQRRLART